MYRTLRAPAVALLVLVVTLTGPSNAFASNGGHTRPAPDHGRRTFSTGEARGVLTRAQRLFRKDTRNSAGRQGVGRGPENEVTLTLRDLLRARSALTGTDRRTADSLLARPTNGSQNDPVKYGSTRPYRTYCPSGSNICIHYVTSGPHAISLTDSDHDGVPNYVEYVMTTMTYVWNYEISTMGYRAPISDSATAGRTRGNPNSKFDVYLAELGNLGLYGYCAPEGSTSSHQLPGYCVLDNNYSRAEYGSSSFLKPMRVTAAHEFFHAIQFGYDVDEDLWFMEGTATWMEDEVFDAINDNYQYLALSPIRYPRKSADYSYGLHPYGAWIFFRYAAEKLHDRNVVRQMWEAADAGAGSAYSLQAIESVVSARTSWPTFFNTFGAWNLLPNGTYAERSQYPRPVYLLSRALTAQSPSLSRSTYLPHLSSAAVRFSPDASLGSGGQVRIAVNGPDTTHGTTALVQTRFRNGAVTYSQMTLNSAGYGSVTTGFDRQTISSVVVVVANASTALRDCGTVTDYDGGPLYSCYGRGVFDSNQGFTVTARAL